MKVIQNDLNSLTKLPSLARGQVPDAISASLVWSKSGKQCDQIGRYFGFWATF